MDLRQGFLDEEFLASSSSQRTLFLLLGHLLSTGGEIISKPVRKQQREAAARGVEMALQDGGWTSQTLPENRNFPSSSDSSPARS